MSKSHSLHVAVPCTGPSASKGHRRKLLEDWPDFVQSANELGIVLPPPAMPPSDPPPLEGTEIQEITRQVSGDAIVDVQVEPLGKPSSKDAAPGHSSLEMADEDATA